MSDAPHVRVRDDGRVEYRASALGGCDMALLAARLGYEAIPLAPNSPMIKVFDRGHRVEAEILAKLPAVQERQQRIHLDITGRIKIIGHTDGFDAADQAVVEVKSQSIQAWEDFEKNDWDSGLFPKYRWQVSCYMHWYRARLKLIRVLVDNDGEYVTNSITFIDEPFYTIPEIRSRILRVEAAAATGVLNAECSNSFPCPYFYLHEEVDRELIDDDTVDALAVEYANAGADARSARGRQTAAKRALREAVEGDKYTTTSGSRVTFYVSKNSPQLDRELLVPFLEGHGRSLDQFMIQSKSEKLRVTIPKEDEE